MCRALQILCVASGRPSLQALKKAAVAQEWELTPGDTTMATLSEVEKAMFRATLESARKIDCGT